MGKLKLNDSISSYRKKRGLTQEELADKLGVTNQSVSKWESAQCCPDISLIPKIADIFEISIDELFGRETLVNNISAQFPLCDDDIFRVVVAKGKEIVSVDDLDKTIDITFPRRCDETTQQYFKVEVFGNIYCEASINGDVIANGQIECNQINGDIEGYNNKISCKGDINGDINVEGDVACGDSITGNVSCGGNVACGDRIDGRVNCGGSIACGDSINGDVKCVGNIECKKIKGDVECQGDIIYK